MNLTALEGAARLERLIVEPLWALEQLRPTGTYVDIGSGNGSPAIPWMVCGGFRRGHLIEARKKRAVFVHQACQGLGLSECTVRACRFSDYVEEKLRMEEGEARPPDWISLQGVQASGKLWNEIKRIRGHRTRVVWLTGPESCAPEPPIQALSFPGSRRRVLVFGETNPDIGTFSGLDSGEDR